MSEIPPLTNFERLSLNTATTKRWSLREAVDGCVQARLPAIGLWRDRVEEAGLRQASRMVRDAGLHVSSLCRGGWFPAASRAEREKRLDDNRRAIDEAAELEADCLVLVCGPAPDRDITGAREMVMDAIATIVPHAEQSGVKLAIEPMHPMFAADRSVVVTLPQALKMAKEFPPELVGVVIDVYHLWWEPEIFDYIRQSAGRIMSYQVCDWIEPLPDKLLGRGMMGDGVIELPKFRRAVDEAGYNGYIEVEIFNQKIWDTPGSAVIGLMKERYLGLC